MKSKNDGPYIIAEIGINHNGSLDIAKQLIDMAAETGCDAVKFQKRTIDVVYTKEELDGPRESPWGATQREQKEGLEFDKEEYDEIHEYCKSIGIDWAASAWDIESQNFLTNYDCVFNKIASAMLTHIPFLEVVAAEGKHTFISTGMSSYEDIDTAIGIFKSSGCPYTLMHTVSQYPCKDYECNIGMIHTLQNKYGGDIGYSGHETHILPTIIAVANGATAVERHITLDRSMYGSDQSASLEKKGLEYVVKYCRSIEAINGDGVKKLLPGEEECSTKLRYFSA